jgi:glucose-6-phosphate dehydrogenase assembly protein OpcA
MKGLRAVALIVLLAAAGYFVWQHFFSKQARIEASYQACMKKVDGAMTQLQTNIDQQLPMGKPAGAGEAVVQGMGQALGQAATGMVASAGSAMCGIIKDACAKDFDGPVCQAALAESK